MKLINLLSILDDSTEVYVYDQSGLIIGKGDNKDSIDDELNDCKIINVVFTSKMKFADVTIEVDYGV